MRHAAIALALLADPAGAAPLCSDLAVSGLLAKCNRGETIALTLSSGRPLGMGPYKLQSGAYYRIEITSDGTDEMAIAGAEFFRAVWLDEVVINDIEVRPLGIDSLEFDDEGTASISFVAIKPGSYSIGIPGARGDSQRVEIQIE